MSAQSIAQSTLLGGTTDLSTFTSGTLVSSLYTSATLQGTGSLSAHSATLASAVTALKGDTLVASVAGDTLIAGAGKDSLYAAVAGDWLVPGNSGSTLVSAANARFLASASSLGGWGTMVGGGASDTLVVTGVATANDLFSKTSGIEVLSLTGGSNVTLSTNAKTAGISTVFGGNGGSTLTQATGDTLATTFVGGSGADFFSIANSTLLGNDSIFGGAGTDTLALAASATLTDANIAKVSGVEVLSLTGASSVVLGANAAAAGIATVYGGATKNTLTQTAADALATTLLGGAGTDLFSVTASQLSLDSIYGGGGKDTLALSSAGTMTDGAFSKVSGIGTLSLTSSSNVTIGTNAAASGISLVSAGASGDTLNQTAAFTAISLAGGNGSDYFSMSSGILSQAGETINGGAGVNTLALTDSGASVADAAFTNDKTIQALVLGSNSSVVLDAKAKGAGIASVFGASGGATISQTAGDTNVTTIVGGSGNDSIAITSGVLTKTSAATNDSIIGGGGVDTLSFNDTKAAAIADTAFSRVKGVSVLALNGDSLTVGANARSAGFSTIIAGATGSITHTVADTTALTLIGGSANGSTLGNAFFESTSAVLAADSIAGGAGTDTLVISSQGIFNDVSFSRVRGVEVLSLTGASQINAGSALKAAGISTVLGGSGGDTFTQLTSDVFTLNGGAGADSFEVTATALRADSIVGGSGTDTLALTSAGTIADSDFAKVSGVEVLQLTSSSTVNLNANAAASGIKTIYAGNNGDVINQTASLSGAATIIGGSGNDLVSVATQAIFVADSLYGGKGVDTLVIADPAAAIVDTNFAKTKGFEVLSLNGGTAVLGVGAAAEGFKTIKIAGGVGQVLNAAAFNGDQHIIDDTSSTGSDSIVGSVNTGTKFIVTADNLGLSTFKGGSGADTVAIVSGSADDTAFANVSGMDVLSLGAADITLGSGFDATGITKVIGGSGSSTITHDSSSTKGYLIDGRPSTAADLFSYDYASLGANDTVYGSSVAGALGDTISLNLDTLVTDSTFSTNLANVHGVEVLSLASGNGNDSVVLGASANSSNFADIIGGDSTTFTQLAGATKGFTLDGSAGSGNTFALNSAAQLAADTISSAGTGDTLSIATAGTITDDQLANVVLGTNSILSLTGSSAVVLSSNADMTGISTIQGGVGSSTISQDGGSSNAYFLDGSAGSGNSFNLDSTSQLGTHDDSILGGSTGDTLMIGSGDVTDANLANVSLGSGSVLEISGSINLSTNADNTGISTIIGSGADVTFTQDSGSSNGYYVDGSANSSNYFNLNNALQLGSSADTLVGAGGDTLQIGQDDIADSTFAHVTNLSVLKMTGSSDVTLGGNADNSGIATVTGGVGSDSFTQDGNSANGYYLDGSAGTSVAGGNLFVLNNASQDLGAGADTIIGGAGTDTLQIGQDDISDASFANVAFSTPAQLVMTGSSDVTLSGNADSSGIATVTGGVGSDSFTQDGGSSNGYYLDGSAGTSVSGGNLFVLNNASQQLGTSGDTIVGGAGTDTLQIGQDDISDASFANVGFSAPAQLVMTGSSDVTLSGNADGSGIATVTGGVGSDSFTQDSGSSKGYYLDGSAGTSVAGGNLFVLNNASQQLGVGGDTIVGGAGTDTLQIGQDDISDASFANVGFSAPAQLVMTGSSDVTLSGNADGSGIATVTGGVGSDSFTQDGGSSNGYYLDGSAGTSVAGGNLFALNNASQQLGVGGDTILGGAGSDTLQIGQDDISDASFANVGFSAPAQLVMTGASDVSLSGNADGSGIATVTGGSGSDTFTQDSFSSNAYYLDGSNDSSINNGNIFILNNASQQLGTNGDTIVGGLQGDTLQVGQDDISDSSFTNVSSISVLQMTGASDVTLSGNADNSGLVSIEGGSGSDTFTQDNGSGNGYYLDGSNDSSINNGNVFILDNAYQQLGAHGDTIVGGLQGDTLQVGQDDINDNSFTNVSSISVLQMTGASDVTLSGNADNSGLVSIEGGSGSDTFTQDAGSGNGYYLDGSNDSSINNGNVFILDNAYQQLGAHGDTIVGGLQGDTLQIGQDDISDSSFTNVSSISVLQMTGASDVTLSGNADNSGIVSVIGGAGNSTFSQDAGSGNGYYISGAAETLTAGGNLFSLNNAYQQLGSTGDTIIGGSGTDTLQIGQDDITDASFAHTSRIEVLQMTGSSDVTLGGAAQSAGINNVIGGTGSSTIDASGTSATMIIDGSQGGANLITAGSGNDTIIAGSGADTLSAGSGADNFVLNNTTGSVDGSATPTILGFNTTLDSIQLPNFGGFSYGLADSGHGDTLGNEIWNLTVTGGSNSGNILARVDVIGSQDPNSNLHLV